MMPLTVKALGLVIVTVMVVVDVPPTATVDGLKLLVMVRARVWLKAGVAQPSVPTMIATRAPGQTAARGRPTRCRKPGIRRLQPHNIRTPQALVRLARRLRLLFHHLGPQASPGPQGLHAGKCVGEASARQSHRRPLCRQFGRIRLVMGDSAVVVAFVPLTPAERPPGAAPSRSSAVVTPAASE